MHGLVLLHPEPALITVTKTVVPLSNAFNALVMSSNDVKDTVFTDVMISPIARPEKAACF
jgi:hypothetical protein